MPRTILIVDDAIIIREMIKDATIEAGWQVVGEAQNGQEAIDKYVELNPDVVTLDMVMPEFDGIHALEGIMRHDSQANILVVSALEQKETLKKAFQLGATDFVVKPFDVQHVVKAVNAMMAAEAPA